MVKSAENKLAVVMDGADIDNALSAIAEKIFEQLGPSEEFALIGIRRRGVHLARRLSDKLEAMLGRSIPNGILDITLYRDDLTTIAAHPLLRETLIDFDINNLTLVLVDDVLYTGRTIRAALDGLIDLGRPKRVQLAVLVDRGGRELPIQADYAGRTVASGGNRSVEVRLMEEDGEERVVTAKTRVRHL